MTDNKCNGMSNKELIIEVRKDVKSILSNIAEHSEWIKNNAPRINSHDKRLIRMEITIGAIVIGLSGLAGFLYKFGIFAKIIGGK